MSDRTTEIAEWQSEEMSRAELEAFTDTMRLRRKLWCDNILMRSRNGSGLGVYLQGAHPYPYATCSPTPFVRLYAGYVNGNQYHVLGHEDGQLSVIEHNHYIAISAGLTSKKLRLMLNPTSARQMVLPSQGRNQANPLIHVSVFDYHYRYMNTQLKLSYAYVTALDLWILTAGAIPTGMAECVDHVRALAARVIRDRDRKMMNASVGIPYP